jgi:hypothetical protein
MVNVRTVLADLGEVIGSAAWYHRVRWLHATEFPSQRANTSTADQNCSSIPAEAEITQFVAFLATSAELVEIDAAIAPPIRDLNDIHILQTAISGKAEFICTLGEHFHEPLAAAFCSDRGIATISDLDLLRLIRGSEERPS